MMKFVDQKKREISTNQRLKKNPTNDMPLVNRCHSYEMNLLKIIFISFQTTY